MEFIGKEKFITDAKSDPLILPFVGKIVLIDGVARDGRYIFIHNNRDYYVSSDQLSTMNPRFTEKAKNHYLESMEAIRAMHGFGMKPEEISEIISTMSKGI